MAKIKNDSSLSLATETKKFRPYFFLKHERANAHASVAT